jgi:sigma-B regulation protein RsbU (phosphoserine phosphatase)
MSKSRVSEKDGGEAALPEIFQRTVDDPGVLPETDEHASDAALNDALILVVDDNELTRKILSSHLSSGGFSNLIFAKDGIEALESIANQIPELVVLDLIMPRMDGFEVLERLRDNPLTRDIPVLVQTALEEDEERIRVFKLGAADLLSKPVNSQELQARVRIHLENRKLIRDLSVYRMRMDLELDAARAMQESLLPTRSYIEGIESRYPLRVSSFYEASTGLGGDIWGIREIDENRLFLYTVDFSGHGVGAALNTFRFHAWNQPDRLMSGNPGQWLSDLNQYLCETLPTGQFATVFCGVVDIDSDTLIYAAASAPPPLLRPREKAFRVIDSAGIPAGIIQSAEYDNKVAEFGRGGVLMLYSDALIETPDAIQAVFNTASLKRFLDDRLEYKNPAIFLEEILDHLKQNTTEKPEDDLTMVCIKRRRAEKNSTEIG